jgi:hypothetical protein
LSRFWDLFFSRLVCWTWAGRFLLDAVALALLLPAVSGVLGSRVASGVAGAVLPGRPGNSGEGDRLVIRVDIEEVDELREDDR